MPSHKIIYFSWWNECRNHTTSSREIPWTSDKARKKAQLQVRFWRLWLKVGWGSGTWDARMPGRGTLGRGDAGTCFPKPHIFVEKFRRNLQNSVWKRHVGAHQMCTNMAPVVRRLDNAIHWINHYPADKYWQNKPRYPLDSDLSGG